MENQCSKQESYHVAEAKQEAQLMNSLLNICRVHIFFFTRTWEFFKIWHMIGQKVNLNSLQCQRSNQQSSRFILAKLYCTTEIHPQPSLNKHYFKSNHVRFFSLIKMQLYTYMHLTTNYEKRGHIFEREQGVLAIREGWDRGKRRVK